jgi:orotate phosphoribosyltransferase
VGFDTRTQLLALLRERSVLSGDFTLSSGQRSNHYLDARLVTLSARGSGLVGQVFLDALVGVPVEAVAGPTLGADPIVTAIAVLAGQQGMTIDALIVRKSAKEHGTGRRIEGPFRPGLRVAVVEDTLTSGASCLDTVEAVEEAGGHILGIWVLIDREEDGRKAIEGRGHRLQSIFRAAELLEPVS